MLTFKYFQYNYSVYQEGMGISIDMKVKKWYGSKRITHYCTLLKINEDNTAKIKYPSGGCELIQGKSVIYEYPYEIKSLGDLDMDLDYIFIPTKKYNSFNKIIKEALILDDIIKTEMKTLRIIQCSDKNKAHYVNIYSEAQNQNYNVWAPVDYEYIIVDSSSIPLINRITEE